MPPRFDLPKFPAKPEGCVAQFRACEGVAGRLSSFLYALASNCDLEMPMFNRIVVALVIAIPFSLCARE
jgi:hypothetical protein